jgi:hypothetical protein
MPLPFTKRAVIALKSEGLRAYAVGDNEVYACSDDIELVVTQEANGFLVFVPGVRVRRYNETNHKTWRAALQDIRFRIGPSLGDDEYPGDPD